MAAERREGAAAVAQQAGALRHLRHSVFGLFFSFSSSSSASTSTSTAVRSGSDGSPNPVALHWAPDAFQALAALETGAGWADAGCVVGGGAGDGDLAGAVSSCHWFIVLQRKRSKDKYRLASSAQEDAYKFYNGEFCNKYFNFYPTLNSSGETVENKNCLVAPVPALCSGRTSQTGSGSILPQQQGNSA